MEKKENDLSTFSGLYQTIQFNQSYHEAPMLLEWFDKQCKSLNHVGMFILQPNSIELKFNDKCLKDLKLSYPMSTTMVGFKKLLEHRYGEGNIEMPYGTFNDNLISLSIIIKGQLSTLLTNENLKDLDDAKSSSTLTFT